MQGRRFDPTFIGVMDLRARGRKGNLRRILNLMKHLGIKVLKSKYQTVFI